MVTGKAVRGRGSQAAGNGGSSGTVRRWSRIALMRMGTAVSRTGPDGVASTQPMTTDQVSDRATALDRPPEEASEDTSFARGLRVLLTISDRGEIRADELSSLLETPISTIYRYLRTLATFGFVDRGGGGAYRLGPRIVIGRGSIVTSEELIRVAAPVLAMLVEETGETAVIARRLGPAAICLHEVPSRHELRVTIEAGSSWPLHAGALAKVLLAYAEPEILEEVVAGGLPPITAATPSETRAAPRRWPRSS